MCLNNSSAFEKTVTSYLSSSSSECCSNDAYNSLSSTMKIFVTNLLLVDGLVGAAVAVVVATVSGCLSFDLPKLNIEVFDKELTGVNSDLFTEEFKKSYRMPRVLLQNRQLNKNAIDL